MRLQIVCKDFGFLSVLESDFPWGDQKGDRVRNFITRFVILHSVWSSGSRDSSVALHWWFIHSLSPQINDLCRRLISAFRAGTLVICLCIRSRFFRRISSWMPAGIGGHGSSRVPHLGIDAARTFRTSPENFATHLMTATAIRIERN